MRCALLLLAAAFVLSCSDDEAAPSSSSGSNPGSSLPLARDGTFRGDVVPIVRNSCALTACHSSKMSNLGIHLTHDPAQIYAELQKESPSFPGVKFVVAGDPSQSLLLLKMEGMQATLGAKCRGAPPCGAEMPPSELVPKEERDLLRTWIQNGAKND